MTSVPARHRSYYVRGRREYCVPTVQAVDHELMQLVARMVERRLERPAILVDVDLLLDHRLRLVTAGSQGAPDTRGRDQAVVTHGEE